MSRSRRQWVTEEKADKSNWFTAGEFAARLGISLSTFERKIKLGKIPDAEARTENGWRIWSPEVVRKAWNTKLRGRL